MEIREAGASLAILSEAQDSCVDSRLPASAAMAGERDPRSALGIARDRVSLDGARSRTRTGTPLLARDFKSPASTDFAIRAVALCEGLDYIQPSTSSQGTQKVPWRMKKAS